MNSQFQNMQGSFIFNEYQSTERETESHFCVKPAGLLFWQFWKDRKFSVTEKKILCILLIATTTQV